MTFPASSCYLSGVLEVYGLLGCPFAWRVRFTAHEKGAPYQWIPVNVPHPDPRAAKNDPQRRSPLVVHEGLVLVESAVIQQYIDEVFSGRPLLPATARDRARARMLMASFEALGDVVHGDTSERTMTRLLAAYAEADRALAAALQPFLFGDAPGLADIALLPLLSALEGAGQKTPHRFAALEAYWGRGQQHEGFRRTAPTAAKMELGA
jgi:glutathione S-transferase